MKARYAARGVVAAVTAALLVAAPSAGASGAARTFTVSGFDDGSGTCAPPDAAGSSVCTTLRAAADAASLQANFPTIELQPGTYQLTRGQLSMGAFTIEGLGPGGPAATVIQQTDFQSRVIEVQSGPAKLAGLEITGGRLAPSSWQAGTTWLGGGILAEAPLVLQDVLITDNQVVAPGGPAGGGAGDGAEGGGIAYAAGTAPGSVISDSVITGNGVGGGSGGGPTGGPWAGGNAYGGGVAYEGTGALTIEDSAISHNTATGGDGGGKPSGGASGGDALGGGVFNAGELSVRSTTISDNRTSGGAQGAPASPSASGGAGSGGGVFSEDTTDKVVNTTVFGNAGQGGAAAPGGSPGAASGGGILDQGASSLTLQSDTIDANQTSLSGGNIDVDLSPPGSLTIRDTILSGGSPDNCVLAGVPASESYNLEDDSVTTCGFTAGNHDLVGANPQLQSSPADNGGATQTLAPAPGSPALGAGAQCLDPTSTPPNQPLTVDQRSLPRSNPCDIGAFEAQPPVNAIAPAMFGRLTRGQTLVCSPGAWTGDGPLTFAYGWLHNGLLIPGATANTYVVRADDAGQSLACAVTASHYGSATLASPFLVAPSTPVITLLSVAAKSSLATVNLGCRGLDGKRCRGGLTVSVLEKRRRGRVVSLAAGPGARSVTLGQHGYTVRTRHTATIHIQLTRDVTRLLARFRKIPCLLTVSQTTAVGTSIAASRRLRIRRPAVHRRA